MNNDHVSNCNASNICYTIRADTVSDEDGNLRTVYGVNAIRSDGKILSSRPDIFFDVSLAESFVSRLNRTCLSLIHLPDVIEDVLAEQYAVIP